VYGSGLSGEGTSENELLLVERFGTVFFIGLLTHLPHGDVTRPKLPFLQNRQKSQLAFSNSSYTKNALSSFALFHSITPTS
jgi:hypothetical protein